LPVSRIRLGLHVRGTNEQQDNISTHSYIWTVTTGPFDFSVINTFFLRVVPADGDQNGLFGSSYLNFTNAALAVTTSSSSGVSSSTAISTTMPSSSPKITPSSAAVSGQEKAQNGLPTAAVLAIPVTALALVLLALVAGWFFWFKRSKQNAKTTGPVELSGMDNKSYVPISGIQELENREKRYPSQVYELGSEYTPPKGGYVSPREYV
jgi:hypothetical protein